MFLEGGAVQDKLGNIFYINYYNKKYNELFVTPKYIKINNSYKKINFEKIENKIYKIYNYSNFLKKYAYILPIEEIKLYYNPKNRLKQIIKNPTDIHEKITKNFLEILLKKSKEKIEKFGIGGSLLIKKHHKNSDIDLFYYGKKYEKIYYLLKEMRKKKEIINLDETFLNKIYYERNLENLIKYQKFLERERERVTEGKFKKIVLSIKIISYENIEIKERKGFKKDIVEVKDSSENFKFPSKYKVKSLINEEEYYLISHRFRYTEMFKKRDKLEIFGEMEITKDNRKQIVISNKNSYIKLL